MVGIDCGDDDDGVGCCGNIGDGGVVRFRSRGIVALAWWWMRLCDVGGGGDADDGGKAAAAELVVAKAVPIDTASASELVARPRWLRKWSLWGGWRRWLAIAEAWRWLLCRLLRLWPPVMPAIGDGGVSENGHGSFEIAASGWWCSIVTGSVVAGDGDDLGDGVGDLCWCWLMRLQQSHPCCGIGLVVYVVATDGCDSSDGG